jgi:hypothetical protein
MATYKRKGTRKKSTGKNPLSKTDYGKLSKKGKATMRKIKAYVNKRRK